MVWWIQPHGAIPRACCRRIVRQRLIGNDENRSASEINLLARRNSRYRLPGLPGAVAGCRRQIRSLCLPYPRWGQLVRFAYFGCTWVGLRDTEARRYREERRRRWVTGSCGRVSRQSRVGRRRSGEWLRARLRIPKQRRERQGRRGCRYPARGQPAVR